MFRSVSYLFHLVKKNQILIRVEWLFLNFTKQSYNAIKFINSQINKYYCAFMLPICKLIFQF